MVGISVEPTLFTNTLWSRGCDGDLLVIRSGVTSTHHLLSHLWWKLSLICYETWHLQLALYTIDFTGNDRIFKYYTINMHLMMFFFSKCCYEPISMSFGYSTSKTFMQFAEYIWCMNDGYVEIIKWILIMCILYSVCRTYFLRQVEYIFVLDAWMLISRYLSDT